MEVLTNLNILGDGKRIWACKGCGDLAQCVIMTTQIGGPKKELCPFGGGPCYWVKYYPEFGRFR